HQAWVSSFHQCKSSHNCPLWAIMREQKACECDARFKGDSDLARLESLRVACTRFSGYAVTFFSITSTPFKPSDPSLSAQEVHTNSPGLIYRSPKIAIIDLLVKFLYLETRTTLFLLLLPFEFFPTSRTYKASSTISLSLLRNLPKKHSFETSVQVVCPNMQALRPIRPTISVLRLLMLALVLCSSVFDPLGGASLLGVSAAPTSPNRPPPTLLPMNGALPSTDAVNPNHHDQLIAARGNPNWSVGMNPQATPASQGSHPGSETGPSGAATAVQAEAVEEELFLIRRASNHHARRESQAVIGTEKWEGKLGDLFGFRLNLWGHPNICQTSMSRGGKLVGRVRFPSPAVRDRAVDQVIGELEKVNMDPGDHSVLTNVFFIAMGIGLFEQYGHGVKVTMEPVWFDLLRDMFGSMGTGSGGVIDESNVSLRQRYLDIATKLTEGLARVKSGALKAEDLEKEHLLPLDKLDI
ncbi:hypothetical protein F5880DRAFT_1635600, partial [Lentinula raphanica]